MIEIRRPSDADIDAIWQIFQAVVARRDSYFFAPETPREDAMAYWFGPGIDTWVAEDDGRVVGMYKLVANHRDLGSHVANASFMVHPDAGGRGIGRAMGTHCLRQARFEGFEAMQFNFVVSTNLAAVHLWQRLGFSIVGTLPKVFRHGTLGLVDAYVMHRGLDDVSVVFGAPPPGGAAAVRPSVYGVVVNAAREIALVEASGGIMLPGGGVDPGESHEQAVIREIQEECALRVGVTQQLGDAIHFVGAKLTRDPVEKRKRYYACEIISGASSTPQHPVRWLRPHAALGTVSSDADRWAVKRWLRLCT